MTYPDTLCSWLTFLEARQPEHQMVPGLDRVGRTARKLLPESFFTSQRTVKVITVGGTNGKGSTVATLTALLNARGIRCGAWTSPHLVKFNERICIAGEMVADQLISDAFTRIETLRGDDFLSYFEFGALAALDICLRAGVEVMLLEVGLGGRLDAVNCIDADLSIVTTVDLDHQAWLGNTIEQIAYEKAGIFRPGRPAICGEYQPANSLVHAIDKIAACELRRGRHFELDETHVANGELTFKIIEQGNGERILKHLPVPPLPLTSVACALRAFLWFYPDTPEAVIHKGLHNSSLTGRCQQVTVINSRGEPLTVLLDVAHNPQAARYLANRLTGYQHPVAVLGMLNDKDLDGVIAPLKGLFTRWHVATVNAPERARSGKEIKQELNKQGQQAQLHPTIADAVQVAIEEANPGQTVVAFGSFHTVGEALQVLPMD